MMKQNNIQLGIIDDDRLVAELLSEYFGAIPDIEICLMAQSGNEFLRKVASGIRPDVVLLDLKMTDGSGLEVLEALSKTHSEIRSIVLTSFYQQNFIGQMLRMNAAAFLPKDISRENLLQVIYAVYERGYSFSREQMEVLRNQVSTKTPQVRLPQDNSLSAREAEVLVLVCQQCTAEEIAEKLFISVKTVESHKSNLLAKTGAKNMAGLVIYAVQHKIIRAEEIIFL